LLELTKTATEPPAGLTSPSNVPPTPEQQAADIVLKSSQGHGFCRMGTGSLRGQAGRQGQGLERRSKGHRCRCGQRDTATPTKLQIAAAVDDIEAKRYDIELTMTGPILRS